MVVLPDDLQQLLRSHHVDVHDIETLRAVIKTFVDPLLPEQLITLVQLQNILQILQPTELTKSDDKLFFCIKIARFFAVRGNIPLASALLKYVLSEADQVENDWTRHLILNTVIEAFAQHQDFNTARNIAETNHNTYRKFTYFMTLALVYHEMGKAETAREMLFQAESLMLPLMPEMDVDSVRELADAFITVGMIVWARKYLEKCVPMIQYNEQHGDDYSHQSWAFLCVEYAKIDDLEMVKKMADLSPLEQNRALRYAVRVFAERGRVPDAEKTITFMVPDDDFDYQLARANIYIALALHRVGKTLEGNQLLQHIRRECDNKRIHGVRQLRILSLLAKTFKYTDNLTALQEVLDEFERYYVRYKKEIESAYGDDGVYIIVNKEVFRHVWILVEIGQLARGQILLDEYLKPGRLWYDGTRFSLCHGYARAGQFAKAISLVKEYSLNSWMAAIWRWALDSDLSDGDLWGTILREAISITALVDAEWLPIAETLTKTASH